jgi:putative ABC transport system permease protein
MHDQTPDWKRVLRQRLEDRGLDPTLHFATIEELAEHLDERYRSLTARGVSPGDAERSVRDELDDEALERELRRAEHAAPSTPAVLGEDARSGLIDRIAQDGRYAARALRRSPGFTMVAVLTLALGVGANTAIFSIVHAVMLQPLPYHEPDRLIRIWESNVERGWPQFSTSQPNFIDFRARATLFEAMAAVAGSSFTISTTQGAEVVRGNRVTADFLPVLGVSPAIGRNFLPEEDRPGGDIRVVLLGNGFWQRRFGSDPSIVGRAVPLDGTDYLVVGVLPPSFQWGTADLLVPLAANPEANRGDHQLTAIGRLRQGVTIDQAHSELAAIAAALGQQYPVSNEGWSVRLASFYDWLIPETTRQSLRILFGAVAVLLAIACANVASLLLARGSARRRELSIRAALGGTRRRLVHQLLTEALLLSLMAAAAGLALGAATTRLLVAYGPASVPRLEEAGVDATVVLFSLAVSMATVFLFGLIPAIQISRQEPSDTLREGTRSTTGGAARQHLRSALTVIEVALSVALLIGAGLLFRSFWRLQQVDPGFDLANLTTARITFPDATYNLRGRQTFYDRLLAEIRALPGIVSVATTSALPLTSGNTSTEVHVPGFDASDGARPSASWRLVSPAYFATMGIPLRGRDFSPHDVDEARNTIIISETMARAYWPALDPLGRTITPSSLGNRERTIIGVAGDVRALGIDVDPPRTVSSSTTPFPLNGSQLVWRSAGDPASHIAAVREVVRRIDSSVPLYDVRPVSDLLSQSFSPRRFNMSLLGVFAAVAILLSAIGLFGVMAYLVSQRTREIGVRLALGARRAELFRLVIGRGLVLACLGAAIGLAAAFWLTQLMTSLLFSVSASDPVTFGAVPAAMVVVALLACYVPARRAMRVDPVIALRAE